MSAFIVLVVVSFAESFVNWSIPIKYNYGVDVYIQYSVFRNVNDDGVVGGGAIGIGSSVRSVSITDCTFVMCRSIPSMFILGYGGACYIAISTASITRCCGESCWAFYGSFIYFFSRANVNMTSIVHCAPYGTSSIEVNSGAIFFSSSFSPTIMSYLNFSHCFVQQHGAAIYDTGQCIGCPFYCQHMTVVNCSGRTAIYSRLQNVADGNISYSNFVNNNATLALLYGNTYGMVVSYCKFRSPKNIPLFDYGPDSTSRRFLVSHCDFSGEVAKSEKVSMTDCNINTRAVTWPICFFNTMVCPAKCYSDTFTVSKTFMFSLPFIFTQFFWQSGEISRSSGFSRAAFQATKVVGLQSQPFLSTKSENLVPSVIFPSFSIAKSLKAFVNSHCFHSQPFLSTESKRLVPSVIFPSFSIGKSLQPLTSSGCFQSHPFLSDEFKGFETDEFYFTAPFDQTLLKVYFTVPFDEISLKTYFTALFGETSTRLIPRPKMPVPEENLISSNKTRLVVTISSLVAIAVFSALLICMVVVCISRKRAKKARDEGFASWQSDPVRWHELETLAVADMGRTGNSSSDVVSSSVVSVTSSGRDIVTENLLKDFL